MSFSASWHRRAGAQPFCLWGWLCVSPGLAEAAPPALPCSNRGCGPEACLACSASLSWTNPVPLGSGTLTEGLWSGVNVGSVYTAPWTTHLCSHIRAGEWGCLRPRNHPADGCHHALSILWCFSLTPLPFTAQKCLQQIDTRAAGVSSAKELKCIMALGPSVEVLYTPA